MMEGLDAVPDNTDFGVRRGVTGFCLDETTMGETANTDERVCNQGEESRCAKELQQLILIIITTTNHTQMNK
jgi:hypothetical protein